jgi:hypothetical protein
MLDSSSLLQPLSMAALLFVTEAFAAVMHAAEHAQKEMSATLWTTVAILRTVCPSARAVHAAKMDAAVLVKPAPKTMMLRYIAWECR